MSGDISKEELGDILNVLKMQYGYDFTNYAQASLKRRITRFMANSGMRNLFDLKYRLVNDSSFFSWFVQSVTVNVTEMFRDPEMYRVLRNNVLPRLETYPIIKIWHAGCSTGEEVYSLAILLYEMGLLNRTRIYATDINPLNLEKAQRGIIPAAVMKTYVEGYIKSGGKEDFSDYYTVMYDNAIINKELRKNVVFSQHNLVTDSVFNEFHLISCRNVLIYFNKELQNNVIKLFYESMAPFGYMVLGSKESLIFSGFREKFEPVSAVNKIFRRKF